MMKLMMMTVRFPAMMYNDTMLSITKTQGLLMKCLLKQTVFLLGSY